MTSHRILRFTMTIALLGSVEWACSSDHVVGSDLGSTQLGQHGGQDSGTCAAPAGAVCNEPNIPEGCWLGQASCDDGQYLCPPVVCPTDAGSTSDAGDGGTCAPVPCAEPKIPPGCSLGPSSCENGSFVCPSVVCPIDAGTVTDDAGCTPEPCSEPAIPPGCTLGPSSCDDGVFLCPPVVCPDGG